MIAKSWNIRDQTEKDLAELLEKKYKEILRGNMNKAMDNITGNRNRAGGGAGRSK